MPDRSESRHKIVSPLPILLLASLGIAGCSQRSATKTATTLPGPIAAPAAHGPVRLHPGLPQDSVTNTVAPNMLSARDALVLVKAERDKFWLVAKHEVYKSSLELAAQDQTEKLRGLHMDKVLRGAPGRHEIALTFDDGPHPGFTLNILKTLKQNDIHATFFVVGEKAEQYPDLIRAEVAAGDSIGNHTYDHVSLVKIPTDYVATEIKACGDVIQNITGKRPTLFRPPGGEYNRDVADTVESLGYRMILYSADPGDYADPGTQLIETRTLDTIRHGGIILLHDGSTQTLTILPQLIQRLKARGFHFVTVDKLLQPKRQ
jgi:peptidoglycan/xylan/chitin deacetylase (PgdA/CDA1 family)